MTTDQIIGAAVIIASALAAIVITIANYAADLIEERIKEDDRRNQG